MPTAAATAELPRVDFVAAPRVVPHDWRLVPRHVSDPWTLSSLAQSTPLASTQHAEAYTYLHQRFGAANSLVAGFEQWVLTTPDPNILVAISPNTAMGLELAAHQRRDAALVDDAVRDACRATLLDLLRPIPVQSIYLNALGEVSDDSVLAERIASERPDEDESEPFRYIVPRAIRGPVLNPQLATDPQARRSTEVMSMLGAGDPGRGAEQMLTLVRAQLGDQVKTLIARRSDHGDERMLTLKALVLSGQSDWTSGFTAATRSAIEAWDGAVAGRGYQVDPAALEAARRTVALLRATSPSVATIDTPIENWLAERQAAVVLRDLDGLTKTDTAAHRELVEVMTGAEDVAFDERAWAVVEQLKQSTHPKLTDAASRLFALPVPSDHLLTILSNPVRRALNTMQQRPAPATGWVSIPVAAKPRKEGWMPVQVESFGASKISLEMRDDRYRVSLHSYTQKADLPFESQELASAAIDTLKPLIAARVMTPNDATRAALATALAKLAPAPEVAPVAAAEDPYGERFTGM